MARGRGGIFTDKQYQALRARSRRSYEKALEVRDLMRANPQTSFSRATATVGIDTRDVHALGGSAFERRGRRIVVRANDRLFMGSEPLPMPTPDGIYDALPGSWRQRSLIGSYWSLVGRSKRMSDEQLRKELAPFRFERMRVLDPERGRIVRMGFDTNIARFRSFASSPEAQAERIISPRLGYSDLNGNGR